MNAILLTCLMISQAPAEAQPAAPAEEAAPAKEAAAEPAKEQAASSSTPAASADANVPRANDAPVSETSAEQKIGKIVSGVVLAVGGVLLVVGLVGLASAGIIQAPILKNEYPPTEAPRRTAGTIASALAAGGLMLGLTCVLGGIFGVFVG